MKEKEPLVSVIVPVYNVEKYLRRCLDSVINQTYKKLEIILVDDGSTDRSGEICDEYAKKDKRIKVIHKENGGLSSARNAGMARCSGYYIFFLDGDDELCQACIELMCQKGADGKYDIVVSPYVTIENGKRKSPFKHSESKEMEVREALKELLMSELFDVSACGKLYRSDIVRDIRFPEGMLCEDNGTTYRFFMNAEKVFYLGNTLYIYYINDGSIMSSIFDMRKYDLVTLNDEMCRNVAKQYRSLNAVCFRRRIYARLSFLRQVLSQKNVDRNDPRIRDSRIFVKKNFTKIFFNRYVTFKDRVAVCALMVGDWAFVLSWKIYSSMR